METEAPPDLEQRRLQNLSTDGVVPELDTVRALHQTVISLRTKLGTTEEELRRLREFVGDFSGDSYASLVESLSLENHILRRKIMSKSQEISSENVDADASQSALVEQIKKESTDTLPSASNMDVSKAVPQEGESEKSMKEDQPKPEEFVLQVTQDQETKSECSSEDKKANSETPVVDHLSVEKDLEELSLRSMSEGDNSVFSDCDTGENQQQPQSETRVQSEDESEELDDIELIFTTDETCRDVGLQEDLVSITDETWQIDERRRRRRRQRQKQEAKLQERQQQSSQPVLLKYTKTVDLVEGLVCNGAADKVNSSVEEAVSSQSSSIDREESIDKFDESSSTRLHKIWSQCSVLVETDISKCGVLEEEPTENSAKHTARRNTLAAPLTMVYRPIIHREALALSSRRKSSGASNSTPLRPVVDYSSGAARRESGAQTDISALPNWRSESYLAHKVAHTFTTLPSKFALPTGIPGPGRLRLSEKTREARRVMLSDYSFTSMVPELSRSADHLCHEPHLQTCYNNNNNNSSSRCGLRTPENNRRESLGSPGGYWSGRCNPLPGLPSPCDCRLSSDFYATRYRSSLSSIPSPGLEVIGGPFRRHSWRSGSNTSASSFDNWRMATTVPVAATATPAENNARSTWSSSMPSSPTHIHPLCATRSATATRFMKHLPKRTRSKVTFQECPMSRGSLPNLHSDLIGETSGDSTESLIDEAEDYLRRSIDSMMTTSSMDQNWIGQSNRRRRTRRYSEPDLFREWNPPQDARPYLPKIPRDLKLDHLVKVISPEGKVLQGRVRYVGPVPGRDDPHVGVELPTNHGFSDGTFHGKRFFLCELDHAIFVPFKKVVLAWCTT